MSSPERPAIRKKATDAAATTRRSLCREFDRFAREVTMAVSARGKIGSENLAVPERRPIGVAAIIHVIRQVRHSGVLRTVRKSRGENASTNGPKNWKKPMRPGSTRENKTNSMKSRTCFGTPEPVSAIYEASALLLTCSGENRGNRNGKNGSPAQI